jgi:uncharacterized protein (DUF1778 family)
MEGSKRLRRRPVLDAATPDAAAMEQSDFALSARDSEAFVYALLSPQPLNDRLRETIRRYREWTQLPHS